MQSSSKPVVIVLVWTDEAGAVGCDPCLVNDLELGVYAESTGEGYSGNIFEEGTEFSLNLSCTCTCGPSGCSCGCPSVVTDYRNNVEVVRIPAGVSGDLQVTVTSTTWGQGAQEEYLQLFAVYAQNACLGACS